jgi:hypothetical protein
MTTTRHALPMILDEVEVVRYTGRPADRGRP